MMFGAILKHVRTWSSSPKDWCRPIEEHRQYTIERIVLHTFRSSLRVIMDEVHRDQAGVGEFLSQASTGNLAHANSSTVMGRQ